jgi:hypothetical protein
MTSSRAAAFYAPTHAEILDAMDQDTRAYLSPEDPNFQRNYAKAKAYLSGKKTDRQSKIDANIAYYQRKIEFCQEQLHALTVDKVISWNKITDGEDSKSDFRKMVKTYMHGSSILNRDALDAWIVTKHGENSLHRKTLAEKFSECIAHVESHMKIYCESLQQELLKNVHDELKKRFQDS